MLKVIPEKKAVLAANQEMVRDYKPGSQLRPPRCFPGT